MASGLALDKFFGFIRESGRCVTVSIGTGGDVCAVVGQEVGGSACGHFRRGLECASEGVVGGCGRFVGQVRESVPFVGGEDIEQLVSRLSAGSDRGGNVCQEPVGVCKVREGAKSVGVGRAVDSGGFAACGDDGVRSNSAQGECGSGTDAVGVPSMSRGGMGSSKCGVNVLRNREWREKKKEKKKRRQMSQP